MLCDPPPSVPESAAPFVQEAVEARDKILKRGRFVGRPWLVDEIARRRDDVQAQRLVIIGGPGSGKSTLLAHVALTWRCPCYFAVAGASANDLLVTIGAQLYCEFGAIAFPTDVTGATTLTVDEVRGTSETVGRRIDRLYALPFLPPLRRDVSVVAKVVEGDARIIGEHVRELHTSVRSVPPGALLKAAMLDPLWRIHEAQPNLRLAIIIDAIDETMGRADSSAFDIISSAVAQTLPPNVILVMSSRPGHHLVRFSSNELLRLDDPAHQVALRSDAQRYVVARFAEDPLASALAALPAEDADELVADLLKQSRDGDFDGSPNFLYLHHYFAEAMEFLRTPSADLRALQRPRGLDEIYAQFALGKIWDNGRIEDGAASRLRAVLGALAVAGEPIDRVLLSAFAGVEPVAVDNVLLHLAQFLVVESDEKADRFRLFHVSFREYLLDPARNRKLPLNATEHHRRISGYYRAGHASWATVPWRDVLEDYPFHHLAAHLALAEDAVEIDALLDRPWFEAQFERFASPVPFMRDTVWAQQARSKQHWSHIGDRMQARLLRAAVADVAGHAPTDLVLALAALGEHWAAIEFVQQIPDARNQAKALCRLVGYLPVEIGANVFFGIIDRAIKLAGPGHNDDERSRLFRDVLLHVVRTFTDYSVVEQAWHLAWDAAGGSEEIRRALVVELCGSGRYHEAHSIIQSLVPDARTDYLGVIARALSEAGRLDEAFSITLEMARGTSRAERLGEIACRQSLAGRLGSARQATARLLADFRRTPGYAQNWSARYVPAALAAAGRMARAWEAAASISDSLQRSMALSRLCEFLCETNALEEASRAVEAIAALGEEIYCTAAAASVAKARLRAGLSVDMDSKLIRGPCRDVEQVFFAVCVQSASLDRDSEALGAASRVVNKARRRDALQAVARRQAERGDESAAFALVAAPDALISEAVILQWGATARARRGDVRGAIALIDGAERIGIQAEILAAVINEASGGTPDYDLRISAKFLLSRFSIADFRVTELPGAIASLRRRGLVHEASELVRLALDRALVESDEWDRDARLLQIAPFLAMGNEKSRARTAILHLIAHANKPLCRAFREVGALARIVRSLAAAGLAKEAKSMMTSECQDDTSGSVAAALRRALASGLAAAGQIEEAVDAAELSDVSDRSSCRQAVLDSCCRQVRGNRAAALGRLAAIVIRIRTWDDRELRELVSALSAAGKIQDAAELAKAIVEPDLRRVAARDLSVAKARNGDFASANVMASELDSSFDQMVSLVEISAFTAAAGRTEQALADLHAALNLQWGPQFWRSSEIDAFPSALGRAIGAIAGRGRYEAFQAIEHLAVLDGDSREWVERETLLVAARSMGAARHWAAGERLVRWVKQPSDLPPLVEAFLAGATDDAGFVSPSARSTAQVAVTRLSELLSTERIPIERALAPSLAWAGEWELALKLSAFRFRRARGLGPRWDDEHEVRQAAIGLASAAATQNNLDQVEIVAMELTSEEMRDDALAAAALAFAAQRNCSATMISLGGISSSTTRLDASKRSALSLARSGDLEAAFELILGCGSICAEFSEGLRLLHSYH